VGSSSNGPGQGGAATREIRDASGRGTGRESDEISRCTGGLSALELQHGHADGQEQHDPRNGGHETQVHVGFQQVPAASEDAPQGRRGHGQRQTVADVPQQDRHALHRPDDA